MLGSLRKNMGKPRIYGFDHAVLNVQLPPTMWMNMGYWEVSPTSLYLEIP